MDTEHPHSASHSQNCSFSEIETSELPFSPAIPKEVTASLHYSWGPRPEHAHWPQRTVAIHRVSRFFNSGPVWQVPTSGELRCPAHP